VTGLSYGERAIAEAESLSPAEVVALFIRIDMLEATIRKALPDLRANSKPVREQAIRLLESVL
jgi:hypothetical protein